jgi:hypothetical protein
MENFNDIRFYFEIAQLGVHRELNGKNNVVYEVRCFVCGEKEGTIQRELIVLAIPTDNLDNFIEYEKLTKEIVEGWISSNYSDSHFNGHRKNIIELFYPTKYYTEPPFNNE